MVNPAKSPTVYHTYCGKRKVTERTSRRLSSQPKSVPLAHDLLHPGPTLTRHHGYGGCKFIVKRLVWRKPRLLEWLVWPVVPVRIKGTQRSAFARRTRAYSTEAGAMV